jgi:hypothetical protein
LIVTRPTNCCSDGATGFNRWEFGGRCPGRHQILPQWQLRRASCYQQQDGKLNAWLAAVRTADERYPRTPTYLKAKMCGRWPRALCGQGVSSELKEDLSPFIFKDDVRRTPSAHIRRPAHNDKIFPPRLRPLFRHDMPYGPLYDDEPASARLAGHSVPALRISSSV